MIKDLFGIQVIVNVSVINHDYENCKCRKKLVDKLVNECTENIDEVKLAKITLAEHENKYENMRKCSCTLYIALFSVLLTITIGISTFFVYYEYMMVKNIC